MTRLKTLAAAALIALPLPAASLPFGGDQVPLVFGDSLSDPGNLAALVGLSGLLPQFPNDQITDGDTWATQIGADFSSGRNFAVADALANGDTNSFGVTIPGFASQIDLFLASPPPGSFDTAIVFFGGNDLLEIQNPLDPVEVATTITDATAAIRDGIDRLAGAGVTEFLVMGLPNAARLPGAIAEAAGLGPFGPALLAGLTTVTESFNASLQAALGTVPPPATTTYFDTFAEIEALIANAASLGITNTTEACLLDQTDPTTVCSDPGSFFFYDDLHWSDSVHGEIAAAVAAELDIAPIPLPAGGLLLLGGIGALAAARLRTRRQAA